MIWPFQNNSNKKILLHLKKLNDARYLRALAGSDPVTIKYLENIISNGLEHSYQKNIKTLLSR
jgi:hypothetical protein